MDGSTNSEELDNFNWDSEEELEKQNFPLSSCLSPTNKELEKQNSPLSSCLSQAIRDREDGEGSREAGAPGPSCSNLYAHFEGMGFSKSMVAKAIQENGERDTEAILETLLTHSALEKSPSECEHLTNPCSSESVRDFTDDELSDMDSSFGDEEITDDLSEKDKKLLHLVDMGYAVDEATSALDRCGASASILELADSVCAAQMGKTSGAYLGKQPCSSSDDEDQIDQSFVYDDTRDKKRMKWSEKEVRLERKIHFHSRYGRYKEADEDDGPSSICIPKPMVGFGVPSMTYRTHRKLPDAAMGPPYFYYENVALAPKGVWEKISRFLYDIEPEFVDSKHFCAAARKRGYIHNLPIHNRFPLQPLPPRTIHEALPMTRKWWPSWDSRTQLNCLQTCTASAKLTERIRQALAKSDEPPPPKIQQYVLNECRKWNLVWVGVHKVAPLEPDEIEMLLGFPRDHTRGGGISRTERFKSLGNSFQVDTVAFHLSVLKEMFPNGITLLSLFSGIGGAEVALHRLGIPLKNVLSVEISEINRNILRSWWGQTNQTGNLTEIEDVQQLTGDKLEQYINRYGGFDLIIGGSPCNNLTGSNRVSRDGLEGIYGSLPGEVWCQGRNSDKKVISVRSRTCSSLLIFSCCRLSAGFSMLQPFSKILEIKAA